jgi:hypothetical protein
MNEKDRIRLELSDAIIDYNNELKRHAKSREKVNEAWLRLLKAREADSDSETNPTLMVITPTKTV